jgi:hypothetical protein
MLLPSLRHELHVAVGIQLIGPSSQVGFDRFQRDAATNTSDTHFITRKPEFLWQADSPGLPDG